MWCAREIYERVSAQLLNQGAVSEDENGSSRLRAANGRKCAVGSLVSDEFHSPDIEGIGISYYRHAPGRQAAAGALCIERECLRSGHRRSAGRT